MKSFVFIHLSIKVEELSILDKEYNCKCNQIWCYYYLSGKGFPELRIHLISPHFKFIMFYSVQLALSL